MKLGCKCKKHKGQAAIRIYANHPGCPLLPCRAFSVIIKLRIIWEPSFAALLLTAQLTQQRNANVLRIMILFSTSQVFRKYHNKGGFYRPGRVKVSLHVAVSISSTICPIISTKIQSWSRLVGPRRGTRTLCVRWWPDGLSSLDWWW